MICNCSPPLGPRCTQKAVLVHILRCIGKGKSNSLRPPFSVYSGPLFRLTQAPFSVYSGPLFGLLRPPFRFTPDTFFHNPQQKHTLEKFTPGKSGFTPGHFRVYSGLFSGTFSGLLRDIFGFTAGPVLHQSCFVCDHTYTEHKPLPSHFLSFLRNCPKAEF